MATLGIKGHPTRGGEVIQLLEMLGGENKYNLEGTVDSYCYYIDDSNKICSCSSVYVENVIVFTLEEFEEKFPYKVGDKVIVWIDGCRSICNIQNMEWDSIANEIKYKIQDYWYSTINLQPYIEELTMKNKSKLINIEPKLVGNECVHFPIPTGMKLEVKDGMCYLYRDCGEHKESKCLQELKEYLDNATPEQLEEDWKELEKFSEVGPVADEYIKHYKREGVNLQKMERKLDEALEKETTESLNKWLDEENVNTNNSCTRCVYAVDNHCGLRGFTNDFNRLYCSAQNADKLPNGFELQPDGYFSWVDSKPQYPKTYNECYNILNEFNFTNPEKYDFEFDWRCKIKNKYYGKLMQSFVKLLICRDAYWKIAGEEMGLDKPWEPDYDSGVNKYGIISMNGVVQKSNPTTNWERHLNKVLEFPTEEMRDAFFENFKDLIEECKELL